MNKNKHKQQCSKLAAHDNDTINAANYTMQLLQTTDTNTHHYCFSAIHPNTGIPTKYQDHRTSSEGAEWIIEMADEIGQLAQGNKDTQVQGTNTWAKTNVLTNCSSQLPQQRAYQTNLVYHWGQLHELSW